MKWPLWRQKTLFRIVIQGDALTVDLHGKSSDRQVAVQLEAVDLEAAVGRRRVVLQEGETAQLDPVLLGANSPAKDIQMKAVDVVKWSANVPSIPKSKFESCRYPIIFPDLK